MVVKGEEEEEEVVRRADQRKMGLWDIRSPRVVGRSILTMRTSTSEWSIILIIIRIIIITRVTISRIQGLRELLLLSPGERVIVVVVVIHSR